VKLLPGAAQPGQAGTLLGAVYELIAPQDPGVKPAFASTRALGWWAIVRPMAAASRPCGDSNEEACPACRAGRSCPRDVTYQAVAEMAVLGTGKELTRQRIDWVLLGKGKARYINRWQRKHLELAKTMGLHLIVPRRQAPAWVTLSASRWGDELARRVDNGSGGRLPEAPPASTESDTLVCVTDMYGYEHL